MSNPGRAPSELEMLTVLSATFLDIFFLAFALFLPVCAAPEIGCLVLVGHIRREGKRRGWWGSKQLNGGHQSVRLLHQVWVR